MNVPNKLTMLRIILIPVFVALMMLDGAVFRFIALAVFAVASFTDFLDGFIARRDDIVTDFGKLMDPMADKLLVMAALIGLLWQGKSPFLAVLVILARETVIMSIRLVAANKGTVIAAGMLGKIKTVLQLIAILCMLCPLFEELLLPVGEVLLWASAAMSVWSLIDYLKRNKEVISQ